MAVHHPTVDSLIHIADVHFWKVVTNPLLLLSKRFLGNVNVVLRRRHEFALHLAEPYADAVAARGIPFAVLTGDFTSTATHAEFEMAKAFVDGLRRRGMDIALMPGNHDVYTRGSERTRRFESYFQDYLPDEEYPWRRDLPGGTPLVVVPTVSANLVSSRGRVGERALIKLADLLADCRSPLLVAGHYPLLHKTYAYTSKWSRQLRDADALRAVLGRSGKDILYISGHVHRFAYVRDSLHRNVRQLTTGAFIHHHKTAGTAGEFAEVHVTPEGFSVTRHTHQGEWREALADLAAGAQE
jgi:3',5'-cyclic AMP phosphodiesterase CpdA